MRAVIGPRWRVAFWVALPAILLWTTTGLVNLTTDIRNRHLIMDPAALVGFPFYYGIFTYLAVLLWGAAATVCLFAYVLLRSSDRDRARYFLTAGLFTTILCVDDLLMLHEDVLPFQLGIDELIVVTVYGGLAIAWIVRWYAVIVTEGPGLLVASGIFLGASALLDVWDPGVDIVIEDGFKLLGIGCWLGHFARAAARVLRPAAA